MTPENPPFRTMEMKPEDYCEYCKDQPTDPYWSKLCADCNRKENERRNQQTRIAKLVEDARRSNPFYISPHAALYERIDRLERMVAVLARMVPDDAEYPDTELKYMVCALQDQATQDRRDRLGVNQAVPTSAE